LTKRLDEQLRVARLVLEKLRDGPLRWTPLMKATLSSSGTPSTFRSTIYWLIEHDYVERPERGVYCITQKGRHLLEAL